VITFLTTRQQRRLVAATLTMAMCAVPCLGAQDDLVMRARGLAVAGQRAEAIVLLRDSLAVSPGNTDARVLLGTVLSWEGRYAEARLELGAVLAENPSHADALPAMANVELWSLQHRHRWKLRVSSSYEGFSDDRVAWQESNVSMSRTTPIGPIILSGWRAKRFGLHDNYVELEMYPRLRRGMYAHLAGGYAPNARLYPRYRYAGDLYQSLGAGFEGSAGVRHLSFGNGVNIYSASLSKYHGRWLFTGRVSVTPESAGPARSYLGLARRYFGDAGTHVGMRYGRGARHDELRNLNDLDVLDSDVIAAETTLVLRNRLELNLSGSYGREDRVEQRDIRQYSIVSGVGFRF
jgi:YaiO family outer membrane protein